jgi:uncharacterized membrane protein
MDKQQDTEEPNTSTIDNDRTSQPDYSPDNQVDASFVRDNLESLDTPVPMQNSIQNAQFNISNPIMPVKDMVKLEEAHPGAIDRILAMGEREQSFTHQIIQLQHNDQLRINDRNIEISKEQNNFNRYKLFIVSSFILILIACATYLFLVGPLWGGLALSMVMLILASIFILGHFPSKVFEALFQNRSQRESSDKD